MSDEVKIDANGQMYTERGENEIKSNEICEEDITNKTFEELQKEVIHTFENNPGYRRNLIRAEFSKKDSLRSLYLALIKINPEKCAEIEKEVYIEHKQIYRLLYRLLDLGVVQQIAVMDIINGKLSKDDPTIKIIFDKFNKFSGSMNDKLRNYYSAKTNYWVLTKSGKDPNLVQWALNKEKDIRHKQSKEEND